MGMVEPIAIIGMSFRFPGGAETADEFWKILMEKRCTATTYPEDRFNIDAFWSPDASKQNIINSREGHFLSSEIKSFDAGFFSVAPHEVASMDPQHRGIMETTYHAFESAGLSMKDVARSKTSVHIGCFTSDFATMQTRDTQNIPKYNCLGTAGSMLANRVSWFYDLHGESMYVDTACSSSLVALALGCQGLLSGESDMAVVGGSNIIITPESSISLSNMSFLSPTGRCKSFDANADGYGRGEGLATLILKPVSKAIAAGNPIRALIRSVGMNQDGHTSGGITQPSQNMQVKLIRDTYKKAELDLRNTRFFEAHGTGTPVGDPTEARAIGEAFFKYRSSDDPIYVGAVKSNLGHLEGASGLAGVIKTVLALERGVIPPNTNFETLNPHIDAEFFNLRFPTESLPWPKTDEVRRASVNSFGFGGTNCHVVLEAVDGYLKDLGWKKPHFLSFLNLPKVTDLHEYTDSNGVHDKNGAQPPNGHIPTPKSDLQDLVYNSSQTASEPRLLILSASDKEGISRQAQSLSKSLPRAGLLEKGQDSEVVGDIIFTLNRRGTIFEWKSYGILGTLADASYLHESVSSPVRTTRSANRYLGLVFTGQGAQWPRMGYELLEWPAFLASMLRSQKHLHTMGCRWNLIEKLSAYAQDSRLDTPEFSQATTTAVQIALVDLMDFLGIKPSVVVGHSSGEIAAAYCAGFLCHQSAMRVSYFRGVLAMEIVQFSKVRYGMASVGLSPSDICLEFKNLERQDPDVFDAAHINISCMNSPTNSTISGPVASLDAFVSHLGLKNIFARKLKVDLGYHSPQMNAVSSKYRELLVNLRSRAEINRVKMVSSVLPGLVDVKTVCSGEYWIQNMVSPVRFSEAMDICCRNTAPDDAIKILDRRHTSQIFTDGWLEIGPHAALKGPIREIFGFNKRKDLVYASMLVRNKPATITALEAVGQMFCRGFQVDLDQVARVTNSQPRQNRIIVDLPQYPFNHSVTHWEESSRSRAIRFRQHKQHPLLGSQAMDWNPLDARWRFIIRKDDIPWVSHHRLHGRIWYPAAGMLVMAIEAVKQLVPDGGLDFELKNVSFTAPIIIDEADEDTEIQIRMTAATKATGHREVDYRFRIFAKRMDDTWYEVCDGTIIPQTAQQGALDVNRHAEANHKRQQAQKAYATASISCQNTIQASEMYRKVDANSGIRYGHSFQRLTSIHYDDRGRAHAELKALDEETARSSQPFTIHPATLDSVFQLAIPALSNGLTEPLSTLVPSRLTRLWISHDGAGFNPAYEPGSEIVNVEAKSSGKRGAVAFSAVFLKASMQMKVQVEELELIEAAGYHNEGDSEQEVSSICHELHWAVDPTLLDAREMFEYCSQHRSSAPEPQEWYANVKLMLLGFANQALEDMRASNQKPLPSMEKYVAWLQEMLNKFWCSTSTSFNRTQNRSDLPSGVELQRLAEQCGSTGHRGAINALMGRQLQNILIGEADPLEILFADPQCLSNVYEENLTAGKAFPMLSAYLDAWVHKDPGLRFLEIGAGTGATTNMILGAIANPSQGPRYAEYVFTDISSFFFLPAQEKFSDYDRVRYHTLNIEQDLEAQGFELGSYDIVVAGNVLHATKQLSATLLNVRRLLKPHGKLILVEVTTPHNIETSFVWGSLPGWWLGSEEDRQLSPVVQEDRWDHLLKEAGFNGAEQIFRDWNSDACHGWSIMVSSATTHEYSVDEGHRAGTVELPSWTIIIDDEMSDLQVQVAGNLQYILKSSKVLVRPAVITAGQFQSSFDSFEARHCILLADLERSHILDDNAETFQLYQKIITKSKSVLWVKTRDQRLNRAPYYSVVEGMCRVCRNENPFVKLVNLVLEYDAGKNIKGMARQIAKILGAIDLNSTSLLKGHQAETEIEEYMEISGYLCINRLRQAKYLDKHIFNRTENPTRAQSFNSAIPLIMSIKVPGLLDTIEWVEDMAAHDALPANQVEIEVQAVGVNFKDGLTLLGRVNSDELGTECAGRVRRVGSDVKGIKVGDRVAAGHTNLLRTRARVEERCVARVPDSMPLEAAAGVPTAFCTAYYCLYDVARLKKGESILIHAAAGGTGQAAVQIAQQIGAEIFATVGSAPKRDFLVNYYGIQEDHIFNSRDASFADGVRRMTDARGVDVILNSLSGKLLVASWETIAEFGRFVEIGGKDINSRGFLPMFPFAKNATFAGVHLGAVINRRGQESMYLMQEVFNLMKSGILRPSYPLQTFPMGQADQAFRLLASGKSTGKIVLTVQQDAVIRVKERKDSDYRFSKDATYVIAGGFGGIGRQIIRWMVRRGARNILLLVRSGPRGNPEKLRVVEELEAQDINLRYMICDISDAKSVQEVVGEARQTMPPFRGCFQAAMTIQDRPFETMSNAEWCAAINPKVHGTWNLHMALPSGMDFFVMLSSAISIFGNSGQANYAAGNSFQDALARYRVARGEKAVAINLGMVLDEGWVAERRHIRQRVMQFDEARPVPQSELFAIFDYYCNPSTSFSLPTASQIVTGLELPARILRSGRGIPDSMKRPLFRAMHQVMPDGETSLAVTGKSRNFAAMFEEADTLDIAAAAVAEELKLKLCKVLGVEAADKTINDQMSMFGIDSLIALEVRNWLAKEMRADLAVYEILGDVKLIDTGLTVAQKSEFRQARWDQIGSLQT